MTVTSYRTSNGLIFKTRAEAESWTKHNYPNGEVEEVHMYPTTQLLTVPLQSYITLTVPLQSYITTQHPSILEGAKVPLEPHPSGDLKEEGMKSYGGDPDIRFKTREEANLWSLSCLAPPDVREFILKPNVQLVWFEDDGVELPEEVYNFSKGEGFKPESSNAILYGSGEGLLPNKYHGWGYIHSESMMLRGKMFPVHTVRATEAVPKPLCITSWSLEHELGTAHLSDGSVISLLPMGPSEWVLVDGKLECSAVNSTSRLRATPTQLKELAEAEVKITAEQLKELAKSGVKSYRVVGIEGSFGKGKSLEHLIFAKTHYFKTSIEASIQAAEGAIVLPTIEEPKHQLCWKDQGVLYGSGEGLLPKARASWCLLGDPEVKTVFQGEVESTQSSEPQEALKEQRGDDPAVDQAMDTSSPRVVRDGPHGPVEMLPPQNSDRPFTDRSFTDKSFTDTSLASLTKLDPLTSTLRTSSFMPEINTTSVIGTTENPILKLERVADSLTSKPSYGHRRHLVRFKTLAEAEIYLGDERSEVQEYSLLEPNVQLIWVESNGEDVDFITKPKDSDCIVYGSKDGLLPKKSFLLAPLDDSVGRHTEDGLHPSYIGSSIHTARVTGYRVCGSKFRTRAEAEIWSTYMSYTNPDTSIHPLTTKVDSYRQLMWGENEKGEVVSPFVPRARVVYGSSKGLLPPKGLFDSESLDFQLFAVRLDYSPRGETVLFERSESGSMSSWLGAFGFLALLGLVGKASTKGAGARREVKALDQEELGVVDESLDSARREHSR